MNRRFSVLAFGMRLKLTTIQSVIVPCAVLHNIACDNNEIEPPELLNIILLQDEQVNVNADILAHQQNARAQLVRLFFSFVIQFSYRNHIYIS